MNWIQKLFRSRKVDEPKNSALNKYIVSCSLREQIKQRQDDYYMLIKSNRRNIEIFCKEPIIEWRDDGKDKRERYLRRKRLEKYEMFLYSKIEMLNELRGLEANYYMYAGAELVLTYNMLSSRFPISSKVPRNKIEQKKQKLQ